MLDKKRQLVADHLSSLGFKDVSESLIDEFVQELNDEDHFDANNSSIKQNDPIELLHQSHDVPTWRKDVNEEEGEEIRSEATEIIGAQEPSLTNLGITRGDVRLQLEEMGITGPVSEELIDEFIQELGDMYRTETTDDNQSPSAARDTRRRDKSLDERLDLMLDDTYTNGKDSLTSGGIPRKTTAAHHHEAHAQSSFASMPVIEQRYGGLVSDFDELSYIKPSHHHGQPSHSLHTRDISLSDLDDVVVAGGVSEIGDESRMNLSSSSRYVQSSVKQHQQQGYMKQARFTDDEEEDEGEQESSRASRKYAEQSYNLRDSGPKNQQNHHNHHHHHHRPLSPGTPTKLLPKPRELSVIDQLANLDLSRAREKVLNQKRRNGNGLEGYSGYEESSVVGGGTRPGEESFRDDYEQFLGPAATRRVESLGYYEKRKRTNISLLRFGQSPIHND